jgi:uncharacterized phage protein (TIGR01671 family)
MREIIFRGKRKDNGEWVEGYYARKGVDKDTFKHFICVMTFNVNGNTYSSMFYLTDIEVIPETVGQYTGLTDKNGTKIFEGDILSAHLDDGYPENETMLEVVWHNNGWYGKNGKFFDDFDNGFEKYFEVIGNIYDNSELLK